VNTIVVGKIPRPIKPCRFKSGRWYQFKKPNIKLFGFFCAYMWSKKTWGFEKS